MNMVIDFFANVFELIYLNWIARLQVFFRYGPKGYTTARIEKVKVEYGGVHVMLFFVFFVFFLHAYYVYRMSNPAPLE